MHRLQTLQARASLPLGTAEEACLFLGVSWRGAPGGRCALQPAGVLPRAPAGHASGVLLVKGPDAQPRARHLPLELVVLRQQAVVLILQA